MRARPAPDLPEQELRLPFGGLPGKLLEVFPPQDCLICTAFAAVKGIEVGKALKLLGKTFQQTCACGMFIGAHGAEHPHRAPPICCEGIH